MYKHILYATDFSKASLDTEKKVVEFSKHHGSQLSILHVVGYGSSIWESSGGYFVTPELTEETVADSNKALEACQGRMRVELLNTKTVQGSPKQKITNYAEEIGADLIILGSHGHFQISDILGTTATGVLHKAKCDVLVFQSDED